MQKESIDTWLSPLENIKVSETPAFLFTRINQAIQVRQQERVSPKKTVLACILFCLLLVFNGLVLFQHTKPARNTEALASGFHLVPANNLYQ